MSFWFGFACGFLFALAVVGAGFAWAAVKYPMEIKS